MAAQNVIYEVNIEVAPARESEYDAWLETHVTQMLGLPGFIDARIFASRLDNGNALRSVHYRLVDQGALNDYLDVHAPRMRAGAIEQFGDDIVSSRRILSPAGEATAARCLNCQAPLPGQYCAECGQRHRTRRISVFQLLRDVFEDVLDWDARIWRSLRPLLFRPGRLTTEYLAGRRMYYTPPLRMYLALSVIFFVMASLAGIDDIDFDTNGSDEDVAAVIEEALDEARQEIAAAADAGADPELLAVPPPPSADDLVINTGGDNLVIRGKDDCQDIDAGVSLPGVSEEAFNARLARACERFLTADGRREFARNFIDLIPTLLIIMLPLIALAGKVYYLFARRYYVEHLLFYSHFHAFVFLYLILLYALFGIVKMTPGGAGVRGWLIAAAWLYGIFYLYRALRVVFGQGRILTVIKFGMISITYLLGAILITGVGILFTALAG